MWDRGRREVHGGGPLFQAMAASRSWLQWATRTELGLSASGGAFVLALGLALGAAVPADASLREPFRTASSMLGWVYFSAWSVSFWPQVIINFRRKSVVGLSFDYVWLNLVGFSCYSAYNLGYFWNADVRAQYARAHGGSLPAVQLNDVFFGLHAVFATLVTLAQMAIYERGGQTVSAPARALLAALLLAIAVAGALAGAGTISSLEALLVLSYLKLCVSLTKYVPQAVLNWRRRSTVGWSIHNVLLDFTGGLLSVAQLALDCVVTGDWSGAIGDPVKFGLGFASMVFDIVFMVQHYALYPEAARADDDETEAGAGGYAPIKTVTGF